MLGEIGSEKIFDFAAIFSAGCFCRQIEQRLPAGTKKVERAAGPVRSTHDKLKIEEAHIS